MVLDQLEHKRILLRILREIYTDTTIGPFLGFKGGTAAYLFYDLARASVDLDFDLLNQDEANTVLEKVTRIAEQYGAVKDSRKKRYSLFLLISYDEGSRNIKIEINLRDFHSRYEVKQYMGIAMNVMVPEDMFAHKLVAMYERAAKASRDIFDVNFFLKKHWQINKKIIEDRTGLSFADFIHACIELLETLPDRGILSGMGELLDESQKDWVKTKLREDTIFNLRLLLESEQK